MPNAKIGKLRLFGVIGDEIDDLTAGLVDDKLGQLADADEIEVRLNSPGGIVYEGIAIYNILQSLDKPITVIVEGMALSVASLIAMAGDRIVMRAKSLMMINQPWNVTRGNAETHRQRANGLDFQARAARDIYATRTGQPPGTVWRWMDAETWFEPEDAVAAGLATDIQGEAPDKALAGVSLAHLQLTEPATPAKRGAG